MVLLFFQVFFVRRGKFPLKPRSTIPPATPLLYVSAVQKAGGFAANRASSNTRRRRKNCGIVSAASIYGILPNSVDTKDSWSGRSSESVEHLRRNLWPGRRVGLRARPAGQPNRRVPAYEETCALTYALNTTQGNHNHNLSPW